MEIGREILWNAGSVGQWVTYALMWLPLFSFFSVSRNGMPCGRSGNLNP